MQKKLRARIETMHENACLFMNLMPFYGWNAWTYDNMQEMRWSTYTTSKHGAIYELKAIKNQEFNML